MPRPSAGLALVFALACANAPASGRPADLDVGEAAYASCAVCHMPGGEGIERVFPPLVGRTARLAANGTDGGRGYLVDVVTIGLVGRIDVDGIPYTGAMPAQGLDDARTAAVLNYVAFALDGAAERGDVAPFTAGEVAAHRATRARTFSPQDVRRDRERLGFGGGGD